MGQSSQYNSGQTKLRTDLIFSQQNTGGENAVIVKDPVMKKFFRFREAEHFIAQQLDGSTPCEVIRQRVEERFGTALTTETLEEFIDKLRRRGLLEGEAKVGPEAHQRGRVRGSLFYLRLKAFDPDWLLNHLNGHSRFFFTPHFLAFSAAIILLGCGLTVVNWREIEKDILRLYRVETLLFGWLTILFVAMAHEFAHGLTCKHFGGEVHEIGFLLLYFQPAFYCNVSEAWLFSEKSKRLWVTFAGPYFELFLAALATLIWRVTDPATWLNAAALVVMAVSGIRTFLNLIPLIKLDGYYFLSDYLDIPNLRQRAFSYLGSLIKQNHQPADACDPAHRYHL
jgi:putative peptide zinc metalloprotease protein